MAIHQNSKIGGATFAGLTWQSKPTVINKTGLSAIYDFPNGCSEFDDQLTTYVNIKEWNQTLRRFVSPPYVDCGYVK